MGDEGQLGHVDAVEVALAALLQFDPLVVRVEGGAADPRLVDAPPALARGAGAQGGHGHAVAKTALVRRPAGQIVVADPVPDLGRGGAAGFEVGHVVSPVVGGADYAGRGSSGGQIADSDRGRR